MHRPIVTVRVNFRDGLAIAGRTRRNRSRATEGSRLALICPRKCSTHSWEVFKSPLGGPNEANFTRSCFFRPRSLNERLISGYPAVEGKSLLIVLGLPSPAVEENPPP